MWSEELIPSPWIDRGFIFDELDKMGPLTGKFSPGETCGCFCCLYLLDSSSILSVSSRGFHYRHYVGERKMGSMF
jgi:hypothetical protein